MRHILLSSCQILHKQALFLRAFLKITVHLLDSKITAQYVTHILSINRVQIELCPYLLLRIVIMQDHDRIADIRGKYGDPRVGSFVIRRAGKFELFQNFIGDTQQKKEKKKIVTRIKKKKKH